MSRPLSILGGSIGRAHRKGVRAWGQGCEISENCLRSVTPDRSSQDLIPAEDTFERTFDTFEVLLARRYIVDGGPWLPTGQYGHRRNGSSLGHGVPEQLHAEMQRESTGWPPVVSGLFDGTEQAELAMSGLIERLAKLDWG